MADVKILFEWRNDYATMINSLHQDEVEWENHIKWLTDSLHNPHRKIYVAELDGLAVGSVRFDYFNDHADLSWMIAPDARGKGYGSAMLRAAVQIEPDKELWAVIKMENRPSQKMAENAGFNFWKMQQNMGVWKRDKRRDHNGPGNAVGP